MKKISLTLLIFAFASTLIACDENKNKTSQTISTNGKTAIGTNINTVAKPKTAKNKENKKAEYQEITWKDLEVPGNGLDEIFKKFEKEIEAIPEGSPKEKEMLGELQAALNTAPVNPAMDKKKIKIPGYISPLEIDEKEGLVKEFLLVPYFGACIHVPPPPLNQTLLIKPPQDQQIKLDDSYDPVWVSGFIQAETTSTKLAEAGYKISDVKIEPYEEPLRKR